MWHIPNKIYQNQHCWNSKVGDFYVWYKRKTNWSYSVKKCSWKLRWFGQFHYSLFEVIISIGLLQFWIPHLKDSGDLVDSTTVFRSITTHLLKFYTTVNMQLYLLQKKCSGIGPITTVFELHIFYRITVVHFSWAYKSIFI